MAGARGRRGRGDLLHEMGFSLVGCIRNLTLNVAFESGKNAETVISVQRKNITEYDAAAFDDAELPERVEPDGERSDQTFRVVDDGKGEGKKGQANSAVVADRDPKEGHNFGRRTGESGDGVNNTCSLNRTYKHVVTRGSTENGSVYEIARETERASINASCYAASEQNLKPISVERSHSIEVQFDHIPVVKETYYPGMQKHCLSEEKSEPMARVVKEYALGNPSSKDNQHSWLPDDGNKGKDFLLGKPNREEKDFPKLPDYGMKEQHFNKPYEFVRETMRNKTDFSQRIVSREVGPANQISSDFQSRQPSRGCFTCGKEGHMARDCPSKKTAECRICRQEGHLSRDCTAKKAPMQCHNCGQEGHLSRDCTAKKAPMQCHNCGQEGHMSRDCTAKKAPMQCRKCDQEGHMSRDCTAEKAPMQCRKCGQEGHMSRDCTAEKAPMQCRKCGQEGHMSRDCTAEKAPIQCRKCGQEGHMSRDCTAEKAPMQCHNCGQEGHISRDCTAKKAPMQCRNCGQEGHMSRDCTAERAPMQCHNCGQEGHMSRDCTAEKTPTLCYGCGQEGHIARDCPKKTSMDCRRCNQVGHMARDCPNSEGAKDDKAERPPPYIPPPPPDDDEAIFETLLKGINFNKYDEIPVECTGRNAPASGMNSFFDFGLSDVLQNNIKKSKYDKPTPIQKWAIPVISNGRDVMACAVTGSGKTAAFLLPILNKIIRNETVASSDGVALPEAVILSPTRELAVQIYHETCKFAHDTMVNSAVIYGGVSVMYLFMQLNKGAHVVVATPGRLLDLIQKGKISLSRVKHLVLDEADRMLDLGFMPDIHKIVDEHGMPGKTSRQTLMFSATFPDEMQMLASEMLNDYIFITVGCVGGASEDIEQIVHNVPQSEKRQKLFEILKAENARVVVFVELKRNADFLSNQLTQSQFPTASIHGDLSQKDREAGLRDFRTGRAAVLVATSVCARGLDIPEVKHVINFDMPSSIEEYVHRIGRTGRCGNLGKATSFFDPDRDSALTRALVKVLVDAKQVIPDWLEDIAVHAVGTGGFTGRSDGRFGARDNRRQFGRGRPRIGDGDSTMCENVVSTKQQQQQEPGQQLEETWDD